MAQARASTSSLELLSFVPFRLNRLAAGASNHLSQIYRDTFALDIAQWRVLVTVAAASGCTAQHIADSTRMHKTRVSRAIAQLVQRELVARSSSCEDARALNLQLTLTGRQLYAQLVPLARARERAMMACLNGTERRVFIRALDRLEDFLGLPRAASTRRR